MRNILSLSLLIFIMISAISCGNDTVQGYGDGSKIASLSLSSPSLSDGESFVLDMDMYVAFIGNVILREVTADGGVDISLYYTSLNETSPRSLTFTYLNGKLFLGDKSVATVREGVNYKIFVRLCDYTNSCIYSDRLGIRFGASTLPPDNGTTDPNAINLDYALLSDIANNKFGKMPFFANTIEKDITLSNQGTTVANVSIMALGNLFSYKFLSGSDTATIPAGGNDSLTVRFDISKLSVTEVIPEGTVKSEKFSIQGLIYPLQTAVAKPINVVGALCTDGSYIPDLSLCSYTTEPEFVVTTAEPLAGFAIDNDMIKKFQTIGNVELKFEADFFTDFEKDSRTTCIIGADNKIALDKQCFVFIKRKTANATRNLTATGTGIVTGKNSINFKFIEKQPTP